MKIDIHRAEIRFSIHAISRLRRIDPDIDAAIDVVRNVLLLRDTRSAILWSSLHIARIELML